MVSEDNMRVQVPPRVHLEHSEYKANSSDIQSVFVFASVVASVNRFGLVKSMGKPKPYTLAKLVIPAPESKDQRWLIKFWVWDDEQNKKILVRDYSINKISDLKERRKVAQNQIQDINDMLSNNHIMNATLKEVQDEPEEKKLSIREAILDTLEAKKSIKHYRDYKQKLETFLKWLTDKGVDKSPADAIKPNTIQRFLLHLKNDKNLSVRTINNYIAVIGLVYNLANKLNDGTPLQNPAGKIEKKKNPKGKNIAFTQDEQLKLLQFMKEQHPWMALFCITMFYTLARTDELAKLKFSMIGRFDKNKIHFPSAIVKNGHNSGIDKNVVIPDELLHWFEKYDFKKYPKTWYVFGKGFQPSDKPYNSKYFGNRFRELVLDKFGFSKEYTLYSWKATGTSMYVLNGATTGSLMLQGGWEDPQSFKSYLKSLGLLDNSEIATKAPKLSIKP